jgi:hypothetical protein
MWEARGHPDRIDELVTYVLANSDPAAEVYRNDLRVVVIDPTDRGVGDVPAELVARPPHRWRFDRVEREAPGTPGR